MEEEEEGREGEREVGEKRERETDTLLGTWVPFRRGRNSPLHGKKPLKARNDPLAVPRCQAVSLLWFSGYRPNTQP